MKKTSALYEASLSKFHENYLIFGQGVAFLISLLHGGIFHQKIGFSPFGEITAFGFCPSLATPYWVSRWIYGKKPEGDTFFEKMGLLL